jgi:hypothetical protein
MLKDWINEAYSNRNRGEIVQFQQSKIDAFNDAIEERMSVVRDVFEHLEAGSQKQIAEMEYPL